MKIKIIDTGNANLLSLYRAVKLFESNVEISSNPKEIVKADKIFYLVLAHLKIASII